MTRGERLADPDDPEPYPQAIWHAFKSRLKEPHELCDWSIRKCIRSGLAGLAGWRPASPGRLTIYHPLLATCSKAT